MNILMVTASISRSGAGMSYSLCSLSRQLAGTCSVQVMALRDALSGTDIDTWVPLSPNLFDPIGPSQWGYCPALKHRMGNNGASIVHACGVWTYPSYSAAAECRRKRLPFVISPHGMLDPWALANSAWKKRLAGALYANRTLRSAACIHALCESEYRSIRAYGLSNPVAVIPNGIDLPDDSLRLPPPWADRLRPGRRVLLFLGRIHPKKGLANLIEAWVRRKSTRRMRSEEWALVIAGWSQGGHEDELKARVREAGLEEDTLFLGPAFDDDKRACLQNANAFILPSFSEGLPMSVLEAWSYGLPVMMTAECNLPEGFAAAAAVEVRPERDSLVEGLDTLMSMSDVERRQMGMNGHRLVQAKFAWREIADQMMEVYQWCLGYATNPDCIRLD